LQRQKSQKGVNMTEKKSQKGAEGTSLFSFILFYSSLFSVSIRPSTGNNTYIL